MSNKIKLQNNNTNLQAILETINTLPEAADAYAVIAVTYPEGSVCTCSNGSETLELDNDLGYGFFLVPEDGKWTVTSTDKVDSTKTKSVEIEITNEGQFESVVLVYQSVIFSAETGLSEEYAVSGTYLSPTIDVTHYTSLEVSARLTWASSSTDVRVGLSPAANVGMSNHPAAYLIFGTTLETKTLDISNLTGIMHLGFFLGAAFSSFTITESNNTLKLSNGAGRADVQSIIFK